MMLTMRTTVTLDEDVAALLKRAARDRDAPFKRVLNDAVRAGLGSSRAAKRYRLPTSSMGLRSGVNLDKASRLATELEDEEIARKLEMRK